MNQLDLCVNVDHVATLRQARRAAFPDPVEAARRAEEAGAAGITIHLRADRRHIQDSDLVRLREAVRGKLNLEIAATDEMVAIAVEHRPDQVSLVPERPEEITTEGGLDLTTRAAQVAAAAARLRDAGIHVSAFLDPEPRQIHALLALGDQLASGFEINTDRYTSAPPEEAERELGKIVEAAELGASEGLAVYAGHGLATGNVGPVAAIPQVTELNIGHFIVSRAVMVGMGAAVQEMLEAMAAGRRG